MARTLPDLQGTIRRRLLLNYRVAPDLIARFLPAPLQPATHRCWAIAGICLIRVDAVRPKGFPRFLGVDSENTALRVAVQWFEGAALKHGVYVIRRDTDQRINAWAGGRLFPGVNHLADFESLETETQLKMRVRTQDPSHHLLLHARETTHWPAESVFDNADEASAFHRAGSIGISESRVTGRYEAMELRTEGWATTIMEAAQVQSAFFNDTARFPVGTVELDHLLVMRNQPNTWHLPELPKLGDNRIRR